VDDRREMMRRFQRLNLHHHLEEVETRPARTRRIPRCTHHVRHLLFVIFIGRKAITLLFVGTKMHVHYVAIEAIMRHLVRRRKPCASS